MFCPKCGKDNPPEGKYCSECAFPLHEIKKIRHSVDPSLNTISEEMIDSTQGQEKTPEKTQKPEEKREPHVQFTSPVPPPAQKKDTPQPRKTKLTTIFLVGVIIICIIIIIVFFVSQTGFPTYTPNTGKNAEPVLTTVPIPEMTTVVPGTTLPQITVVPTPSQNFTTAELVVSLNTKPEYGFKMDYPSEWTYNREHTKGWNAGYRFSDNNSKYYVFVGVADMSGSGSYWYSIDKWANNTIKSNTETYCLEGDGDPTRVCAANVKTFYHPVLVSNDPVNIPGTFEARKLVFESIDDRNYGQRTIYIMHSGIMQGYNFTVPNHPEVAVMVDGPVWDYGIGGQGYAIEFYSPTDQMNNTSKIFSHMIKSFETTTKL